MTEAAASCGIFLPLGRHVVRMEKVEMFGGYGNSTPLSGSTDLPVKLCWNGPGLRPSIHSLDIDTEVFGQHSAGAEEVDKLLYGGYLLHSKHQ